MEAAGRAFVAVECLGGSGRITAAALTTGVQVWRVLPQGQGVFREWAAEAAHGGEACAVAVRPGPLPSHVFCPG